MPVIQKHYSRKSRKCPWTYDLQFPCHLGMYTKRWLTHWALEVHIEVMAWFLQETSAYLSQHWPRSMLPYGVTRSQWVNTLWPERNGCHFADIIFIQMPFLEWCVWILNKISFEMCSFWSNWCNINTGSGNGSVLLGSESLPEPVLTKTQDVIWHDNRPQWVSVKPLV